MASTQRKPANFDYVPTHVPPIDDAPSENRRDDAKRGFAVLNRPEGRDLFPNQSPIGLGKIRALAVEVWGNQADADEWLESPHMELDGKTPVSLLFTDSGTHRVEVLLSALDNGFPV